MVFFGFHPALFILTSAGNGQLALGLQELQRVAGLLRAFFFHDGQDLVLKISLAQIVERLARHGAVFDAGFLWDEGQNAFHQGGLPRGTGALDNDGQRTIQLTRDAGQIAR